MIRIEKKYNVFNFNGQGNEEYNEVCEVCERPLNSAYIQIIRSLSENGLGTYRKLCCYCYIIKKKLQENEHVAWGIFPSEPKSVLIVGQHTFFEIPYKLDNKIEGSISSFKEYEDLVKKYRGMI